MSRNLKAMTLLVTAMSACLSGSASAAHKTEASQRRMIKLLEADISRNGNKHSVSKMLNVGDIRSYARFYTFKYLPSIMAIYKIPSKSVSGSLAHPAGVYVVDDLAIAGFGGSCSDTIYVTVRNIKKLDYEISCGAR